MVRLWCEMWLEIQLPEAGVFTSALLPERYYYGTASFSLFMRVRCMVRPLGQVCPPSADLSRRADAQWSLALRTRRFRNLKQLTRNHQYLRCLSPHRQPCVPSNEYSYTFGLSGTQETPAIAMPGRVGLRIKLRRKAAMTGRTHAHTG